MVVDIDFSDSSQTLFVFRRSAFPFSDLWRPFVSEREEPKTNLWPTGKYMYKHFLRNLRGKVSSVVSRLYLLTDELKPNEDPPLSPDGVWLQPPSVEAIEGGAEGAEGAPVRT